MNLKVYLMRTFNEIRIICAFFSAKGLTFTVNADAAWGGYFMTMLTRQSTVMEKKDSESYVPACSLSVHTIRQLEQIHKADTVTIDPHKSGFVPYSAGFLCYRNGDMKKFVKMEATVIAHEGEGDAAIGICTLEGSRPGAAAAGVLMAHNVRFLFLVHVMLFRNVTKGLKTILKPLKD